MFFARAAQVAGNGNAWSDRAIHDTVAKIAAETRFTRAPRQSLLGRFVRYLFERLSDLLDWMHGRGEARVLLYGVGLLVVIVIVARILVERQLAEARRKRGPSGFARAAASNDPWVGAQAAAAAGQFADACHLLYVAVLQDLAREGLVKLHASKTSGDYARELLRRAHPRAAEYRIFARTFDRVVFGAVEVSAEDYALVRAAALAVFQQRVAA